MRPRLVGPPRLRGQFRLERRRLLEAQRLDESWHESLEQHHPLAGSERPNFVQQGPNPSVIEPSVERAGGRVPHHWGSSFRTVRGGAAQCQRRVGPDDVFGEAWRALHERPSTTPGITPVFHSASRMIRRQVGARRHWPASRSADTDPWARLPGHPAGLTRRRTRASGRLRHTGARLDQRDREHTSSFASVQLSLSHRYHAAAGAAGEARDHAHTRRSPRTATGGRYERGVPSQCPGG